MWFFAVFLLVYLDLTSVKCSPDVVFASRSGEDTQGCGAKTSPCASISMAVSHAKEPGSIVYIDGTGTSTDPYTCINVTSQHPGIYVDRSMSLIGYQSPVLIKCGRGQELAFEAKGGRETVVTLIGLVLHDSALRVVDSSLVIDSCQVMGRKQLINVTQDTQSVQIAISNSTCINTTSFVSVKVKASNKSRNSVKVRLTNSSVMGIQVVYPVNPTSITGSALLVTSANAHLVPALITISIHVTNVSFFNNQYNHEFSGLIHVDAPTGVCDVVLNKVTFVKTYTRNFMADWEGAIIKISGTNRLIINVINTTSKDNPETRFFHLQPNGTASVHVIESTFTGHRYDGNGAVLYLASSFNAVIEIGGTILMQNGALGRAGGCLYLLSSMAISVYIWGSRFIDSRAEYYGVAALDASSLTVTVNNSEIVGSSSSGPGGVFGIGGSTVNFAIINSVIANSIAKGPGGVFTYSANTPLRVSMRLEGVRIENSSAALGGIMMFNGKVELSITLSDTTFLHSFSQGGGGAIYAECLKIHLTCQNVSVVNSSTAYANASGGAFYLGADYQMFSTINDSTFLNTNAYLGSGGALTLSIKTCTYICHTVAISNTTFSSSHAHSSGGAIYADMDRADIFVDNSVFTNCSSISSGGAMYLRLSGESNITLSSSTFKNNSSPLSPGGAVYIQVYGDELVDPGCLEKDSQVIDYRRWKYATVVKVIDSDFHDNVALVGGALYLYGGVILIKHCNISNNFASDRSGHVEVEGDSTSVTILDSNFRQTKHYKIHGSHFFMIVTFISTQSAGPLLFANSTLDMNLVTQTGGEAQTALRVSNGGLVKFKDSNIYCPYGSKLNVLNYTNNVTQQNCTIWVTGFRFDCSACPAGQYSLQRGYTNGNGPYGDFQCWEKCPDGASCSGFIKATEGYWGYKVNDSFSPELVFTLCPVGYCAAPPLDSAVYNACFRHRSSTLCGTCIDGYTETLLSPDCRPKGECKDTWFWGVAILFILLAGLYLIKKPPVFKFLWKQVFWFKTTNSREQSCVTRNVADETRYSNDVTHGVTQENCRHRCVTDDNGYCVTDDNGYLKILFYFYQVGSLLMVNSASCPFGSNQLFRFLLGLFNLQLHLGGSNGLLCPFPGINAVTKELLMATQVIGVLVAVPLWYIAHRAWCTATKRPPPPTGPYLGAALETMLLGYASLATTSLKLLQCVPLSSGRRLFIQGEIQCYQWWQYLLLGFVCVHVVPFVLFLAFCGRWLQKGTVSAPGLVTGCMIPLPYLCYRLVRYIFEKNHPHAGGNTPEGSHTHDVSNSRNGRHTPEGGNSPERSHTHDCSNTPEGGNTPRGSHTHDGSNTPEGGNTPEGSHTHDGSNTLEGGNTPEGGNSPGGSHLSDGNHNHIPQTPSWQPFVERVLYGPFVSSAESKWPSDVKYWESVLIGRRLLLIVIYVSIQDALARQIALTYCSVLILFHHSFALPFREFKANMAEAVSLLCLITIGFVNVKPVCLLNQFLISLMPALLVLLTLVALLSQVARLICFALALLRSCFVLNEERQPLLEVTSHQGED
ncbi:uncharacterized protein LOC116614673 isoform X2 [Nematostella vectensis]|uniref:uncharacterized protein LOC116614673 isoform X2 n=1 Tax=Nematostella vectensis TaxID=45351 RepID=UPI0020771A3E|nr:uncharacterized protein LOC116614673 isoform X2 [Nematostella vectensis]